MVLSVLLTILKILGIVLVAVIALVLLIVCLVLFVPFRYRAHALKPENPPGAGAIDGLEADAAVTWLLHLVSLRIGFAEGKLVRSLKIAGIDLMKKKKPKEKKPKEPKGVKSRPLSDIADKKKRSGTDAGESSGDEPALSTEAPGGRAEKEESFVRPDEKERPAAEEVSARPPEKTETAKEDTDAPEEPSSSRTFSDFLWAVGEKIWNVLMALGKRIAKLIEKLKKLKEKVDKWTGFYEDDRTQKALGLTIKELKKILRGIAPKKCSGYVHYGSDDPYSTGKTLSYLAACYPLYGRSLQVVPDFQEKALDGNLDIRGRIFLSTIAFAAVRLYFNKNVKYVIRFVRNRGNKEAE